MSRLALFLLLLGALGLPARASVEPPRRVPFPNPEVFLERESVCLAVVHARPQDEGFQALVSHVWTVLQGRSLFALPPLYAVLLQTMGGGAEGEGLLSFLPVQLIRVDRLGADGRPQPTFAVSVSGWPGLQGVFYSSLTTGADGTPWPTRLYRGETLVLRPGWEDPTRSQVVARVNGTFLNCPTPDRARAVVDALADPRPSPPQTSLLYACQRLDRSQDTWGVLVNREGSLLPFLEWLNELDMERVRSEVGAAELEAAAARVRWMSWEGDVASEDQVDLRVRFQTDTPDGAEQVARVVQKARGTLAKYNRAGHFQVGATGTEVDVLFSMVGFRTAVQSFVQGLH